MPVWAFTVTAKLVEGAPHWGDIPFAVIDVRTEW